MTISAFGLPGWAWVAAAGVLAAVLGSFIGLASRRMPLSKDVVLARSACEACGRRLGVVDLVPIASFLGTRGRCRTCKSPIARRYLAIEAGCAALAVWGGLVHPGVGAIAGVALLSHLVLLGVLDAEHYWLPRTVTIPLALSGLGVSALAGWSSALHSLIGVAVGFASLRLIGFAYRRVRGREGLGGGDAYMLAAAGAWVGWIGLPTVLLWSSAAGLSLVAASVACGRTMRLDQRLPFGVFLALGTWLTWLYGPLGGLSV